MSQKTPRQSKDGKTPITTKTVGAKRGRPPKKEPKEEPKKERQTIIQKEAPERKKALVKPKNNTTAKKTTAKKTSTKKTTAKKTTAKKTSTKKTTAKKTIKGEIEAKADSEPKNVNIPAWKQKIKDKLAEAGEETAMTPKQLDATMESTWQKIAEKQKTITALKRGLFILAFSEKKAGKTKLGIESLNFEGFEGNTRIIPAGYPTWILDSETDAVATEALKKYQNEMREGKLLIHNYGKRVKGTKKRDNEGTMRELEKFALALHKHKQGTLVIDTFSEYCAAAEDRLVEVVGKGFDDNNMPIRKLAPMEWKWRTKEIVDLLQTFRNFGINIILTAQAKPEYINNPTNLYDSVQSGRMLADVLEKVNYWVDVICLIEKYEDEETGMIERQLSVLHSRWEDEHTEIDDLVLTNEDITLTNLVELFEDKL
jgi:hypothetical protein